MVEARTATYKYEPDFAARQSVLWSIAWLVGGVTVTLIASIVTWRPSLMLGLGEEPEEVRSVLADLRRAGVDVVTLGQYLRPTAEHLPVARYVPPGEFESWREKGAAMGFLHVEAGPLVRSSYHAERHRPDPPASGLVSLGG